MPWNWDSPHQCPELVEVVFASHAFGRATRHLWEHLGECTVGRLERQRTNQGERLLVRDIRPQAELPSKDTLSNRTTTIVLYMEFAGRAAGWSARTLLDRINPNPTQYVAVIVLYPGSRQGPPDWDAAVRFHGREVPIRRIHVAGPRMPVIDRDDRSDENFHAERWSRQIDWIKDETFGRVRGSVVNQIGAGRNGTEAAFQFAALGIDHYRNVDFDKVELHNLDAMRFLTTNDIGLSKSVVLARRLRLYRPDMRLSVFNGSITSPKIYDALKSLPCDLIVSTVDNSAGRLAVARLANETMTAHLDIGTSVLRDSNGLTLTGDARLMLPGQGCIVCAGGIEDYAAAKYELDSPEGALKRGRPQSWHELRAGSLVTLNAITVACGVQHWLDLMVGKLETSYWSRLSWTQGAGLRTDSGAVGGDESCEVCGVLRR